MTTAKKTAAKKAPAKKVVAKPTPAKKTAPKRVLVSQRTLASVKKDEMFAMPQEVKEWIERSSSIMKHQANQIEQLKEENAKLKAYRKFAEQKILGTSYE